MNSQNIKILSGLTVTIILVAIIIGLWVRRSSQSKLMVQWPVDDCRSQDPRICCRRDPAYRAANPDVCAMLGVY
jgi:hypothetical protein